VHEEEPAVDEVFNKRVQGVVANDPTEKKKKQKA
jgi:hypothetical protein